MKELLTVMGNTYEKKVENGGFDADFESPLPEELTCCICFLAFRDPMQLSCGHQYCRSCLNKCMKRQGQEFACPIDRDLVDLEKVFPDKAMERKVLSLTVKCENLKNGCEWSGELRSLNKHVQECMYIVTNCAQCSLPIPKMHIDEHVLRQCSHRMLSCGLCKVDYLFKDEDSHNKACKYWPVECVNSCGLEIPRNKMDAHLLECSVSNSGLTCSHEGTSNQDDCFTSHTHDEQFALKLAEDRIYTLEKELKSTREKSSHLEKELNVQKILLETHIKKSLEKEVDMQHRLDILEKEFKSITLKSSQGARVQENIQILDSMEACSAQSSSSKNPEKCMQDVDNTSAHLAGVAEAISQVQELKYGIFVWKVDRYKQNLVEAQHTNQFICSEPFFTSEHGYKLRLQAWLNGHGIGKGMCISLYAQIMKGPHDDELLWPFSLKTKLSILNQLDRRMHRERSNDASQVDMETKQMYFGRPTSEVNIGYGCGTALITHKHAVSNGFVVDDCIYFMCKIDQ